MNQGHWRGAVDVVISLVKRFIRRHIANPHSVMTVSSRDGARARRIHEHPLIPKKSTNYQPNREVLLCIPHHSPFLTSLLRVGLGLPLFQTHVETTLHLVPSVVSVLMSASFPERDSQIVNL